MGFGKREEGIGHEILRVSWREVAGERPEQIELPALREGPMPRRHSKNRPRSACIAAGLRNGGERLALRRQHLAARIGGRGDGAALGPGFEIVDGIDDAPVTTTAAAPGVYPSKQ